MPDLSERVKALAYAGLTDGDISHRLSLTVAELEHTYGEELHRARAQRRGDDALVLCTRAQEGDPVAQAGAAPAQK